MWETTSIWVFVEAEHCGPSGGSRYRPITSQSLASKSGSWDSLNTSARHGRSPRSRQMRATSFPTSQRSAIADPSGGCSYSVSAAIAASASALSDRPAPAPRQRCPATPTRPPRNPAARIPWASCPHRRVRRHPAPARRLLVGRAIDRRQQNAAPDAPRAATQTPSANTGSQIRQVDHSHSLEPHDTGLRTTGRVSCSYQPYGSLITEPSVRRVVVNARRFGHGVEHAGLIVAGVAA